ncbi:hypothetical protein DLAC_06431 [Tieghemostelium lacteum]|uniref:Uncharacterized protein n=1 Tax=Tieghemostelium lacteum TaxID=361077 RepID=A0A151ZEV7_TIELA|nr:hypothetical protein DLAC_06431 [Tieghemostelium lacteum]|eukprot:KYQ92449.1 hypothetical protein DLAC_06431 [Tieghemostelium lacteum]
MTLIKNLTKIGGQGIVTTNGSAIHIGSGSISVDGDNSSQFRDTSYASPQFVLGLTSFSISIMIKIMLATGVIKN